MINPIKRLSKYFKPYLHRGYQQLHSSLFSFSTLANPLLTNKQQYALTAYFAFLYIVNFKEEEYLKDPRPIHKRLSDKSHFENFILEQSRKHHKITGFQALSLTQKNMTVVLNIFAQKQYRLYCQQYLNRKQFITRQYDSKDIYYPTLISGKIMSKILTGENFMINGPGHIGKSFISKLYQYLSDYMIDCRLDKESDNFQKEPFRSILKDSCYYKMRKMLCISFSERHWFKNEFHYTLQKNCEYLNIDMKQSQSKQQSLKQNLQMILSEYKRRNIETTIFLDKAFIYYLAILSQFQERQWKLDKLNQRHIRKYSEIIQMLLKIPSTQLVISNKHVRTSLLLQKTIEQKGFCNIYAMDNPRMEIMDLQRVKIAHSIPGQIQLYEYFWFRLQQSLKNYLVKHEQLDRIRLTFQQLFCLPNTEGNSQNKALVEWNRYVDFYNMKFNQQDEDLIFEITHNNIFNSGKANTIFEIKYTLLQLKKNIQSVKYYYHPQRTFLLNNSGPFDEEVHLVITMCLHYAARSIKSDDRNKNHFTASLKHVENMYFSRPNIGFTIREHVNIVAKQYPFGYYYTQTQMMTIFYNPISFQKETHRRQFIADRFKKLFDNNCKILNNIYQFSEEIEQDYESTLFTQEIDDFQVNSQKIANTIETNKDTLAIN